jgi:transposase
MLAVLRPGGMGHRLSAKQAARMLGGIRGLDAVGEQRRLTAKAHVVDIRRLDRDLEANKAQIRRAVAATDTTVTDIYGVGPVVAAFLIGYTPPIERSKTPDKYAAYNGTAPIEVSSGGKVRHRLSQRGNRTLNHAIHTAAVTQISHHTPGKVYYDKKLDEGKTTNEALRALKRRISNAVYQRLVADAERRDG